MKVLLRCSEPFESTSLNPLGADRALHRMWSWGDGAWLLVKFLDDGATIATTSDGLIATVSDEGERVIVRVERAGATREAPRESA